MSFQTHKTFVYLQTQGWIINDRIFIFGLTIPLHNYKKKIYIIIIVVIIIIIIIEVNYNTIIAPFYFKIYIILKYNANINLLFLFYIKHFQT